MTPLRKRMKEDMQIHNLSPRTQEAYLRQVALFALNFGRSPEKLGPEEIREYQLYLINDRKLAPATVAVAVAALRFLYSVTLKRQWNISDVIPQPKRPGTLLPILSPDEVRHFLSCISHLTAKIILSICYASGLRISEAVGLKIADLDNQRMVIHVRNGKGGQDRDVMLPESLLNQLRVWWRSLDPKTTKPKEPTDWLFPGHAPGTHISSQTVRNRGNEARQVSGISKPTTPHALRAAFAVHLLENGTDLRTIQLLLGHRSIATTAKYLRLDTSKICAVQSPYERLPPEKPTRVNQRARR